MSYINIAHQDYEHAMHALGDLEISLTSFDMTIDFGTDHSQSKIIRDFV